MSEPSYTAKKIIESNRQREDPMTDERRKQILDMASMSSAQGLVDAILDMDREIDRLRACMTCCGCGQIVSTEPGQLACIPCVEKAMAKEAAGE